MSDWELRHGKDLRHISKELRRMGNKEITKRFRTELRRAAAPMVPAVRASIAAIPVKGTSGSTGLRQRLQKATRLQVKTVGRTAGVRVLVDPKKLPDGQKSLPQMMEGAKPWRHPVYARASEPRSEWTWTGQDAKPYFFKVVRALGPRSRIAVNKVISSITRDIT